MLLRPFKKSLHPPIGYRLVIGYNRASKQILQLMLISNTFNFTARSEEVKMYFIQNRDYSTHKTITYYESISATICNVEV